MQARPYTKAPPPMVSPAYNWSGFYIGAMGGYGWGSSDSERRFGGGTVGYNWQFPGSQFVFGIEVDAAGASIKDSQTDVIGGVAVHVGTQDQRIRQRDRPRRLRDGCGSFLRQGRLRLGQQQVVRFSARRVRFGQPDSYRIHRRRRPRISVHAELVGQGRVHVHQPRAARPTIWVASPSIPATSTSTPSRSG